MSTAILILTIVHVAISLVAIVTGLVTLFGMLSATRMDRMTAWFLSMTVATSVTGFFFPFNGFTPALGFGIISLLVLPVAIYARYNRRMLSRWRVVYIITAMFALYLNTFVLVVQSFLKVAFLHDLAPQQNEPPFAIAQLLVLVAFIVLTVLACLRFRIALPSPRRPAAA